MLKYKPLYFFSLLTLLVAPMFGNTFCLQLIDKYSENKEGEISKILRIQNSLLVSLEEREMPPFTATGFITIQRTMDYLLDFLKNGKIITAYHQEEMVGYLLLEKMEGFLEWALGREFDSSWDLDSLREVEYIDQIAVLTLFANQEIEKDLINYAKNLSPSGLLTDVLFEPYPNQASTAFYRKHGFVDLGIMHIEANPFRSAHKTSLMLWLKTP